MPTLVILRHAKSDWPLGVPDRERPLAARGRSDAPAAGRWLAEYVSLPQQALVSPATRTRQTWTAVAAELPGAVATEERPEIYAADVQSLATVVGGLDPALQTVILVGHNPGCEDLAAASAGPESDPDALARMRVKYPTSGIAVVRLAEWGDAGRGSGALTHFAVPRG